MTEQEVSALIAAWAADAVTNDIGAEVLHHVLGLDWYVVRWHEDGRHCTRRFDASERPRFSSVVAPDRTVGRTGVCVTCAGWRARR
jgi:hypothetical protein